VKNRSSASFSFGILNDMNNINQNGFVNIILMVTFMLLSGAVGYSVLAKSSGATDVPSATLTVGENITVTGTVVKDDVSSPVDGLDILTLDTDYGEIRVLYNWGRAAKPCVGSKPNKKAFIMEPGEKVEVYGKVIKILDENLLSICDSREFYVRIK
jgi:hypothetical protein